MVITEEVVRAIMKDCPKDKIAETLPIMIVEVQELARKVQAVRKKKAEVIEKHMIMCEKFDGELAGLQKECKHYSTQYHSDPSGNSDSYYECLICGKAV